MVKYFRRVIKIKASDSPNVAFALQEQALGLKPSGRQILPGVLSWEEYQKRRATWHPMRQCVGLDAEFYEGAENLLYPPEWLNRAEERARLLRTGILPFPRDTGAAIGIDTAEGGDNTAMCVTDRLGVLELTSYKTADTSVIPGNLIALGKKWKVPAHNWVFDRGGGGNVHANLLRSQGYHVRTVGFGDPISSSNKRGRAAEEELVRQLRLTRRQRKERQKEEKYVYMNKRAEMFHQLRLLLDPAENPEGFGIPPEYHRLRFQMTPIPLLYDGEGKIYLPPKHRRGKTAFDPTQPASKGGKTLVEMIGHSPDELDSLVLAVHGMTHEDRPKVVGVAWK